jgi:hypothetical protein
MRRRAFIALLAGAAGALPFTAGAQQTQRMRRIGVLMAHPESDPLFRDYVRAFRQGLLERGWSEERNIKLDFRWGALDAPAICAGVAGAWARPSPHSKYATNGVNAGTNAQRPNRICDRYRSSRQWLR